MSVTIRDVARLAGVSPSTVSRVLNNKGVISDDTAQRILQAMKDLNYVPNDFARSFATGSARTIAIVIDVVNTTAYSNDFFNNTVFGIETTAHKNDYNLMITNGSPAFGGTSSAERLVLGKKIDGIIFPESIVNPDFLRSLEQSHFPCVVLGHPETTGNETSWVDINNIQAGTLAARHLVEKGYRKIAFISDGDKDQFNQDRITGYCRALASFQLPVDSTQILHGVPTPESGQQCLEQLLAMPDPPDAVLCSSDRLALGVERAALSQGLSIPQQLGIVSFDNTPLTELAQPPITSMEVDTYALGVQAAEILIDQIEDPEASLRQTLLSTKLLERASSQRS